MASVICSDSFDELAGRWSGFLPHCAVNTPFQTPQWQQAWLAALGDSAQPRILELVEDDQLLGIAPLMFTGGVGALIGDEDVFDYNDFLYAKDKAPAFFEALFDCLNGWEWTALHLYPLSKSSPTLTHLPALAQASGCRVDVSQIEVSPGKPLPATWDDYLATLSKKRRHELRRKLRRLDSVDGLRWYALTRPEDVEGGMGHFFELMKMSEGDKGSFLNPPRERFFRSVADALAEMGMLRLYFMEIDGEKVASALTFDYASSRMLYNSGYDPQFSYYSVGLLLKAITLREAIEEGLAYYDFLRGAESYKYHLGGEDRPLYKMVVTRT